MLLSSSLISQNHKIKAILTKIFRLIPINLLLKIIMVISSRQISLHRDNNNLGVKILLLNSILNPQRYGHFTKQCIFKPFCSLCFLYHTRGSQQKCYQTKWNRLTPQALMRFRSLPPPQPPQNYRQPQQGYWKQNSYSQYPKQNQAFNASYSRPQQVFCTST